MPSFWSRFDPPAARPANDDDKQLSTAATPDITQAGVTKIEAVAASWSKSGLIIAYMGWGFFTTKAAAEADRLTLFKHILGLNNLFLGGHDDVR